MFFACTACKTCIHSSKKNKNSRNHFAYQIPASLSQLQNLSIFNVSHNSLAGPVPAQGVFPLLDPSSFSDNPRLCGASLSIACTPIPKPIVLNPNSTGHSTPIITPRGPANKIVLSVSAIIAIAAAAIIARRSLDIVIVSLLNVRTQTSHPRASFYVVDSLPGSSPSEDLAIGKLVMFTDDSDSRDEDLLPTAQVLVDKNSEIGRGGFGTVYKANLAAGRTVAVKKLQPICRYSQAPEAAPGRRGGGGVGGGGGDGGGLPESGGSCGRPAGAALSCGGDGIDRGGDRLRSDSAGMPSHNPALIMFYLN